MKGSRLGCGAGTHRPQVALGGRVARTHCLPRPLGLTCWRQWLQLGRTGCAGCSVWTGTGGWRHRWWPPAGTRRPPLGERGLVPMDFAWGGAHGTFLSPLFWGPQCRVLHRHGALKPPCVSCRAWSSPCSQQWPSEPRYDHLQSPLSKTE